MLKRLKLLRKITKYAVAFVMLAVPLYPKFPLINVPGTFVSIRLEDLLILLLLIIWVAAYFPGFRKLFSNKLYFSIVLFLTVGALSLFSAIFVTKTVILHIGLLHWARRVEYLIPFFIGLHTIGKNKSGLRIYFFILIIIYLYISIYGLGQRYLGWPIIITQNEEYSKGLALRFIEGSHINSTFAGHYDLASFLVMTMPIMVSAIFLLKGYKERLLLLLVSLGGLWLLVNSASRISLVSYLVGVTLVLMIVRKFRYIPLVIIVSLLFIVFSSNLQARYARIFEIGKDRLEKLKIIQIMPKIVYAQEEVLGIPDKKAKTTPTPTPIPIFEDRSTSIRLNVEWPRALRALTKNPLLGTGYSSITLATDNDFLRLLGEVGALGFLAFMMIFINIFRKFGQYFRDRNKYEGLELAFTAGFIASFPGIFINAFFIDVFEASKFAIMFWLLTGITISLIKSKE
jgi:hypothetical protein